MPLTFLHYVNNSIKIQIQSQKLELFEIFSFVQSLIILSFKFLFRFFLILFHEVFQFCSIIFPFAPVHGPLAPDHFLSWAVGSMT